MRQLLVWREAARQPDSPTARQLSGAGRRRVGRLLPAALARLLGFAALGLAGTAAQAQTVATLVGNLGQADLDSVNPVTIDVAQGFTTGSAANCYVLDAVVLNSKVTPDGLIVHLATGVSTASAGTTVATLTNPATLAAGNLRFAAPAGTTLSAGTQYWVVVRRSSPTAEALITTTNANAEDAGAAAGWSIADQYQRRNAGSTGGFTNSGVTPELKMRVDGYAKSGGCPGTGPAPDPVVPVNAAPRATAAVGGLALGAGETADVDLPAHFADPDGDELRYATESSDPAVAEAEADGDRLTVRGLAPGSAEVTVTARDPYWESASQTFAVTVTAAGTVWHLPPAAHPALQGFLRVINHSNAAGTATVTATDDAGRVYEPLTLALERRGAAHFSVDDLESGNPGKGLTGATGPGAGGWRLAVGSDALDVEALAYARAADGFLTPLDGTAARTADGALALPAFNPGSNWRQVSVLRLVNPTESDAEAAVTGVDDAGHSPAAPVRLTVPAGAACEVDAAELESGRGLACGEPQDGLGDGAGKWRLRIESDAPLIALGLLRGPDGHLSNLSGGALPADADGVRRVHLFPAAANPHGLQGFLRVVSRSIRDGTVSIRASDGTGADFGTLALALGAGEAVQINADDLEVGNAAKGLTGSTGPGAGDWTLALSSEGVEFDAYAYVRSADGFLAPMGASAPSRETDGSEAHRVAFLNPASNRRQRSVLRLVNPGAEDAQASIEGTDDTGLRPGAPVLVAVPAGGSVELTSAELESGDAASIESGALGDGTGKWRLRIESEQPIAAMSLLSGPAGRLANLSGADGSRGFGHGLLPAPGAAVLESPYECELLARWDAAAGAPHGVGVELLRDGEPDAAQSTARWTHSTRRWAGLCSGTFTVRLCALNADGHCGPWGAESNAVTLD